MSVKSVQNVMETYTVEFRNALTEFFALKNTAIHDASHAIDSPIEPVYELLNVHFNADEDGFVVSFAKFDEEHQIIFPTTLLEKSGNAGCMWQQLFDGQIG